MPLAQSAPEVHRGDHLHTNSERGFEAMHGGHGYSLKMVGGERVEKTTVIACNKRPANGDATKCPNYKRTYLGSSRTKKTNGSK
ncbi:hypothetical protein HRR83_000051 [Exophiala dermatitidis]|uniref:Uncharacterized protein n=1 Tax=Exophiala dermatitidis TaxID=5970 RepID=A0AAN6F463_EXODE|nr:hypothetical protein HRR73_002585 [Exophiala dermatitidis]KAJ4524456.1 hypothetical protein HRR75_000044 [Exophiala dermatitidis]KAJ4527300.1 hypothetical protein HRR74_000052 [Exophiala dermatitidis]KAJ4530855.1 hypothetical protein HRR76_008547 [Exophiala dermatitidis]KAJ4549766.1 hypothetical protein HRR78_004575 [Exophiala dermatitidis]